VDLFTLLAQVFNFLVLVLVLRRFLFKPLLGVMDERESRFVQRREEAEARTRQAQELLLRARQEDEELARNRDRLRAQAESQAAEALHRLLDEARAQVVARREEWVRAEGLEREASLQALRPRLASAVGVVCRQALQDLAGQDLEEQMALRLAARLAGDPTFPSSSSVLITSSRPLGERARQALGQAARTALLEFQTDENQSPGLRVYSGGWDIEWTLDSYLEALEERIRELLVEEMRVPPPPA